MARRPDYNLCVKPKEGPGVHTKIGVAWKDDQDRISIVLHPCVVLTAKDEVWINLYPADYQNQGQTRQRSYGRQHVNPDDWRDDPPPMGDDDVPF